MNSTIDQTLLISCFSLFGFFPLGAMEKRPETIAALVAACTRTTQIKAHNEALKKIEEDTKGTNICKWCGTEVSKNDYLKNHVLKKHYEEIGLTQEEALAFACDECTLRFCTQWELNQHKKNHTEKLPCEHCTKTFARRYGLTRHMKRAHGNDESTSDDNNTTLYINSLENAEVSRKKTPQNLKLAQPRASEERIDSDDLDSDETLFYNSNKLKIASEENNNSGRTQKPEMVENKLQQIKDDAKNTKICKWCHLQFSNTYLISHIRGEHYEKYDLPVQEAKPYKCEECILRFTDKWILNNHTLNKHNPDKNPSQSERTCDECGKVLSTQRTLYEHKLIHLQCRNCSKVHQTKEALEEHMATCCDDKINTPTDNSAKRKDNPALEDQEIAKRSKNNKGAE